MKIRWIRRSRRKIRWTRRNIAWAGVALVLAASALCICLSTGALVQLGISRLGTQLGWAQSITLTPTVLSPSTLPPLPSPTTSLPWRIPTVSREPTSSPVPRATTYTQASIPSPQGLVAYAGPGRATIVWNQVKAPGLTSYKVYVSQRQGGPYSLQATVSRDLAHYVFSGTNGTTYFFKVSAVSDNPGEESTPAGPIAVSPGANASGPVHVTVDGRTVKVNGVPFDARGIKNAQVDLSGTAAQGFNLVYAAWTPYASAGTCVDILNQAQTLGIKIVLTLVSDLYPPANSTAISLEDPKQAKEMRLQKALNGIKNVKDHPALFGYMIADEPEYKLSGDPEFAQYLIEARTRIKAEDPNHVVLVDLTDESHVEEFAPSGDILLFHRHVFVPSTAPASEWDADYAAGIRTIATVAETVRAGIGGKPLWASSFAYGNHRTATWSTPRPPTPDEYTSIFYQWLIGGASGVLAYTYQIPNYWSLPSDQVLPTSPTPDTSGRLGSSSLWHRMGLLNREQEALKGILTLAPSPIEVSLSPSAVDSIKTSVRQSDKLYVLAVNTSPTPLTRVSLSINPASNYTVRVLFENRTLKASAGRWQDDFAAYARHVYELTLAP